jgi:hypothetical protein
MSSLKAQADVSPARTPDGIQLAYFITQTLYEVHGRFALPLCSQIRHEVLGILN